MCRHRCRPPATTAAVGCSSVSGLERLKGTILKLADAAAAIGAQALQQAGPACAGLVALSGGADLAGQCTIKPISVQSGKHHLRIRRRHLHRLHREPGHAALHGQEAIGIHQARQLLAEDGPVLHLLGGTAVVPGPGLGGRALW